MSSRLSSNVQCSKILSFACVYSLIFLLLLFSPLTIAAAAPGSLDPTFGAGGIVSMPVGATSNAGVVLVQPDGKIIAAGYTGADLNTSDFALVRYLPGGALDTTFGNNGVVITDMRINNSETTRDNILGAALQPDGKIVVVGYTTINNPPHPLAPNSAYAVARYNPNGTLDTTFDGDGKIVGERWYNHAVGVVIQPDGKIIYTGTRGRCGDCSGKTTIESFRLNPDGTPDVNFGTSGRAVTETQGDMAANVIRLQPDGKIVIGGFGTQNTLPGFTVARLKPDGTLDSSFGAGGIVFNGSYERPSGVSDIALQPDGKIIAGRSININNSNYDFEITRLNADGSYDNSFGAGGKVIVAPSTFYDSLTAIVVQPNGKIIAAGYIIELLPQNRFVGSVLVRLNPDGTPDPTFGAGGKVIVPDRYILDAALYPEGKLVTSGAVFTVMRFLLVGSRDFDYDGDARADISVFRPSVGEWYISRSSNGAFSSAAFGASGDLIAPADFDGDAKTDISVFRPSAGAWYRLNSSNNSFSSVQFGAAGDLPVPGDFDGDSRADIAVYRPSNGNWYRLNSSDNQFVGVQFGIAEDKPIIGDFDGDGKSDLAVFRPSTGTWYRINSRSDTFSAHRFGIAEDKPVAADYDADGKTDLAVYRPSNGAWYRINSGDNSFSAHQFGITEDKPTPADYDGDGRTDLAVFRPSNGTWYLMRSTAGFTGVQFGATGDLPTPNAFVR